MAHEPGFRRQLYGRYLSTFKGWGGVEPGADEAAFEWFRRKHLPLLRGCDRDAPVLELGSGAGYLLEALRRVGFSQVEGIDVSAEQVRAAAEQGRQVELADVFDYLPGRQAVYAAIVALDFVEHFTKDEITELLRLILLALRPGGTLLLQTPNGQGLFPGQVAYGDFGHLTILAPDSLAQALRLAGFTDIEMHEAGPIPLGWKGALRVFLWKIVKIVANLVRRIETGKTQGIWTENIVCACRRPLDEGSA